MNPTISVIVPVYKVEAYLDRCVESILSQTYTDFELILVDDGSPDNCGAICDAYAEKDTRVRVIHKENGGVSAARNAGLEVAQGEYVTFCDSDDYWLADWLMGLITEAQEHQADMTVGCFFHKTADGTETFPAIKSPQTVVLSTPETRAEHIIAWILSRRYGWEACTRLFRAQVIREHALRFCTTCSNFAEDLGFVLAYTLFAERVHYGNCCGYAYCIREDSMMQSSSQLIKLNALNELSVWFAPIYQAVCSGTPFEKRYPIVHYLLMNNQYQKLVMMGKTNQLPTEIKRIENKAWYDSQTKGFFRTKRWFQSYFGGRNTIRACAFSRYCLHQKWFWYRVERRLQKILLGE